MSKNKLVIFGVICILIYTNRSYLHLNNILSLKIDENFFSYLTIAIVIFALWRISDSMGQKLAKKSNKKKD